jgi:hypothetical protein
MATLEDKIRDYYQSYYSHQLGLRDWKERVENRLQEEEYFAEPMIERIVKWFNLDFSGKRVLVIGAGTGAETIVFHRKGAIVHAIEPDSRAIDILHDKCRQERILLLKPYLALIGRPTKFLDSLRPLPISKLINYIRYKPVITMQVLYDYPSDFVKKRSLIYLFMRYLGIERDATLMLYKMEEKRRS